MAEKEIYLLQNTVFLELFPLPVRGGLPKWTFRGLDPLLLPQRTTVCRSFSPGTWRGRDLLSLLAHWVHEATSPAVLEALSRQLWNRVWELAFRNANLGSKMNIWCPFPGFTWVDQPRSQGHSLTYAPLLVYPQRAWLLNTPQSSGELLCSHQNALPSVLQTDSSYMSMCHTQCDLLSLLISTSAYLSWHLAD